MYSLFKHIFDKAYTKADQLIVLGRDMANVLEQKVGKGENPKITIIENWADIGNIKPQPFPEGKIILEYAGNIGACARIGQGDGYVTRGCGAAFFMVRERWRKKLEERKRKKCFFMVLISVLSRMRYWLLVILLS